MRLIKKYLFLPVFSFSMFLTSCTGSVSVPFIQSVNASFKDNKASLAFEFNSKLSLNLELFKTIGRYGYVQFSPASGDRGFRIATELSTDVFLDKIFTGGIVTTLPNGTPFPSYVNSRIGAVEFARNSNWSGTLYVGVDPGKRLLGASVNLSFIGSFFPPSVNITQKIRSAQGPEIGSVTFFGPLVDSSGRVVKPGGVFVIVNLNDLIGAGQPASLDAATRTIVIEVDPQLELYNPNGVDMGPAEMQELYSSVLSKGREAGVIN